MQLGFFRLPFELSGDDKAFAAGLGALAGHAKLAKELNCTRCVVVLDPADDERPLHQNFIVYQQRLSAVAKTLGEHGIQLGVGFTATPELRAGRAFEFIRNFDALKLLLGMVTEKNVGVAVDLFELWACDSAYQAVVEAGLKPVVLFVADAPEGITPDDAVQTQRLLPTETGCIDSVGTYKASRPPASTGPSYPPHIRRVFKACRAATFANLPATNSKNASKPPASNRPANLRWFSGS
ncbi:MAG: hypothetical protein QM775_22665 [Pirellulales bacterium]